MNADVPEDAEGPCECACACGCANSVRLATNPLTRPDRVNLSALSYRQPDLNQLSTILDLNPRPPKV